MPCSRLSLRIFERAGSSSLSLLLHRSLFSLQASSVPQMLGRSRNTSIRVRQSYLSGGLEAVLQDKKQQRQRQALTDGQAAHLIAIACTPAPDGHDHWTSRLLAEKAVDLGFVDSVSPETIRQMLKKCIETLAARVLVHPGGRCGLCRTYGRCAWICYEEEYDSRYPTVCFLEFHSTPKHGSWLNMAEIEISIFQRGCLSRRADCLGTLRRSINTLELKRNAQRATISWRFTSNDAREKLRDLYLTSNTSRTDYEWSVPLGERRCQCSLLRLNQPQRDKCWLHGFLNHCHNLLT